MFSVIISRFRFFFRLLKLRWLEVYSFWGIWGPEILNLRSLNTPETVAFTIPWYLEVWKILNHLTYILRYLPQLRFTDNIVHCRYRLIILSTNYLCFLEWMFLGLSSFSLLLFTKCTKMLVVHYCVAQMDLWVYQSCTSQVL